MSPPTPDVLVVTPSADRTTPTLCALSLLRGTPGGSDHPVRGLSLRGGATKGALRRAGARVVESPRQPLRTLEHALRRTGRIREAKAVRVVLHRYLFGVGRRPDVILASTIESAWPAARHRRAGTALVTYCHHGGEALDRILDARMTAHLVAVTDRWVAADPVIAEDLVARGVAPGRVTTVRPFVAADPVADDRVAGLAAEIGRRDGEVVVAGFGLSRWHDGPDLFLRTAAVVRRRHPDLPVRFVWVGAPDDGPSRWILDHDVRHAGLTGCCTLTGSLDDTDAWLALADVVLVTERVEPAAPIVHQAAAAGVPVVAPDLPRLRALAEAVGGEPALTLVAPLDVVATADAVAALVADEDRRSRGAAGMREHLGGRRGAEARARALWDVVVQAATIGPQGDER